MAEFTSEDRRWLQLAEWRDAHIIEAARELQKTDFAIDAQKRRSRGRLRRLKQLASCMERAGRLATEMVNHEADAAEAARNAKQDTKATTIVSGYKRNGRNVKGYERRQPCTHR
jgi:hypothetical protein